MEDNVGKTTTWNHVTLSGLPQVAIELVEFARDETIWIFRGEMGTGKTTLIRAIGEVLEFQDDVRSPTFGIVNEYEGKNGEVYYHFDFYRIEDESEAEDIGVSEYFSSGHICFIEWPSKIPNLIPDRYILIELALRTPDRRQITVTKYE